MLFGGHFRHRKCWDIFMFTALLFLYKKILRKFFFRALLCALTIECIEPKKIPYYCPEIIFFNNEQFNICHRMDQSVMSILIHNFESEIISRGML